MEGDKGSLDGSVFVPPSVPSPPCVSPEEDVFLFLDTLCSPEACGTSSLDSTLPVADPLDDRSSLLLEELDLDLLEPGPFLPFLLDFLVLDDALACSRK